MGRLQIEIFTNTRIGKKFIASFMCTSPSRIVDTTLTVVGPAVITSLDDQKGLLEAASMPAVTVTRGQQIYLKNLPIECEEKVVIV